MNRFKRMIGRVLYSLESIMPQSDGRFTIWKKYRVFCGRLILNVHGINFNIEKGARFASSVQIGDNSSIGKKAILAGKVIIGDNVMMAPECMIYTKNHSIERTDIPMNLQGETLEKPVVIGNDVWIGARVIILPGVNIGEGSVLGAGCVVTRDVPPYTVVGGVPAKVIKQRK